jgi:hypothetical protein
MTPRAAACAHADDEDIVVFIFAALSEAAALAVARSTAQLLAAFSFTRMHPTIATPLLG